MNIRAEISDEELKFEKILDVIRRKRFKPCLTVTFSHDGNGQLKYTIDGEVGEDAKVLKAILGQGIL